MNMATLEKYRSLSAEDKALVNRVAEILAPCGSCGVVELADLSAALIRRIGINSAEDAINALAAKAI